MADYIKVELVLRIHAYIKIKSYHTQGRKRRELMKITYRVPLRLLFLCVVLTKKRSREEREKAHGCITGM
jgi:hypothetical protein